MKLNINTDSSNWEEAAKLAREYEFQGEVPSGKDNAIEVIRKHKYRLWKTNTAVNVEIVSD